uniref:Uncharacterized protein n=1 Tax=Pristionchus pacificus TaxID=54126 RepID=A0A2A6BGH1_PRIPA|eukprot:PDM64972.1 hypothetical protein PRIPAC_53228 [Pristionchus pacificus]
MLNSNNQPSDDAPGFPVNGNVAYGETGADRPKGIDADGTISSVRQTYACNFVGLFKLCAVAVCGCIDPSTRAGTRGCTVVAKRAARPDGPACSVN